MDVDLQEKQTAKLNAIKDEYSIKMIAMQFYSAFLNKYAYMVVDVGETDITDFIIHHIQLLVLQNDNDIIPDAEFQDHFIAYVSSFVYDYELLDDEAIADLVARRFTEYHFAYTYDGKTKDEAWIICFKKEYEQPEDLRNAIGPCYHKFTSRVYQDAIKYIKRNKQYLQMYTMLDDESLDRAIDDVFNMKNRKFTSFFKTEIPQVFIAYDDNRYKLSIPNLLLASAGLFLEWQQSRIFVTN